MSLCVFGIHYVSFVLSFIYRVYHICTLFRLYIVDLFAQTNQQQLHLVDLKKKTFMMFSYNKLYNM